MEVLQGVWQMRFEGLLGRHERGELTRRKRQRCRQLVHTAIAQPLWPLIAQPIAPTPERPPQHPSHQSYCRSQPVPVDQVESAKARWRALLLFALSLLGSAVARDPGSVQRTSSATVGIKFTLANDVAISD